VPESAVIELETSIENANRQKLPDIDLIPEKKCSKPKIGNFGLRSIHFFHFILPSGALNIKRNLTL
jgi:hypothetical protein